MREKPFAKETPTTMERGGDVNVSSVKLMTFFVKPSIIALVMFVIFVLWGCLLLYSVRTFHHGAGVFVFRQMVWLVTGSVLFFLASLVPFSFYLNKARWFLGIGCGVLLAVLFFGVRVNGMSGWFMLGNSIHFQPSEFAKGALVLYLASKAEYFHRDEDRTFSALLRLYLQMVWPTLLCCALVLLEPDFGSATLLFVAFLIVYYVAGGSNRLLMLTVMICGVIFIALALWVPYARERVMMFFSDDSGWHIMQFRYALAHGGWIGEPGGAAVWANAYLPLPHSDSLFATLVEAAGFVGGLFVLTLFLVFGYLFMRMAQHRGLDFRPAVYIFSIGLLYVVQALLHISVNVVLLPTTGLTLPFLSYGGSSLVSILLFLGMAFSAFRTEKMGPYAVIRTKNEVK